MNKTRFLALLLSGVMALGALTACDSTEEPKEPSTTTAESGIESTTAPDEGTKEPEVEAQVITVAATKGSAGLTGDLNAVFAPESGEENVVTGAAQNPVPYVIYAALSSPTVITSIKITAPTKNQNDMGGVTIDGSVNGTDWVTIKSTGSTITSGKVYNLNVSDETAYSYLRIRQGSAKRTEAFAFRNAVFSGIAQDGAAGDLSKITEEVDDSKLLTFRNEIIVSNTTEGDVKDVFVDNDKSWTAGASSAGNPNYLITTLNKKTEIRKITVKLWDSNRRPRGTEIQASMDGKSWTTLYTIEDLKQEDETTLESGEFTCYINDPALYSFIRVRQKDVLAEWAWTLNTVLIYGVESEEDANTLPKKYINADTVGVTYHASYVVQHYPNVPAEVIWDTSDKTTMFTHTEQKQLTEPVKYWISGKLAEPTVITQIVYYSPEKFAERVRTSYFEVSVDGKTWIKLATLPGDSKLYADSAIITLTVDDDTAYNYIRLVQGDGFHTFYWTLGTVEVKGVEPEL